MPTLLERITANAAQRLTLPLGHQPSQELARYKNYLKVESHRLKILHRGGASGKEVCQARAAVLDLLLRHVFEAIQQNLSPGKGPSPPASLVAIGGYGRGELNPFSDIDIMFLHSGEMIAPGKPTPYISAITDGVLYTLWDIGLKVGHSVRSIEDCVRVANTDMQSKTSLIEARWVTGDKVLVDRMQAMVLAKCVRGYEDSYVAARIADQDARRAKFGNSAYMQEPNIKNGSGGLRDYQNLLWMIFFKYRARTLLDLQKRELIREGERKQLEAAYDFLLRARNELHYHANRAVDVLSRGAQPAVAYNLGYHDRSPSKRIEQFMRDLYTHMRNIYLITRTIEQRLALIKEPSHLRSLRSLLRKGRERAVREIVDGFIIVDDEIRAPHARIFREQPRRMMRVFLHAQQRGLKLHPDTAQLIRNQISLVNREFLKDRHVHETFLEMLNARGNVGPVLRLMHELGFLGKYLPEFGKLTALVQHEFYHQYTADEHTLVCIEKLDEIWEAKAPLFANYTPLLQKIERPFQLYLALLLHDAGKGYPTKKHADLGAQLALNVARRLGLDGSTTHTLCLLVEHHVVMAQISQRRDLDDPSVIRNFAGLIQSPDNLMLLTLHTFADSQATGPELWNGFKDSLLWMLYHKTMQVLTGAEDFLRAEEKQREILADEVRRAMPRSFGDDELQAHFAHLPPRYFQSHAAREIMRDLALVHRFMHLQMADEEKALEPVIDWHNEADRGYTVVKVCTWDRGGLFSKIAGSLSAAGLNILSAQIYTRTDGIILDAFLVTSAKTGLMASRTEKEEFEHLFRASLTGVVNLPALIERQRAEHPAPDIDEGDRIPTVIKFDNTTSDYYTVIEVETEDRVGLLYAISQALSELQLDITVAKIATEKGAAIDSFYVATPENEKVRLPEREQEITNKLRAAIASLPAS